MDEKTRKQIQDGQPIAILHFDKKGKVISEETYNLENISLSEEQTEQLARATYEACKRFYADPENIRRFEEWKENKENDVVE